MQKILIGMVLSIVCGFGGFAQTNRPTRATQASSETKNVRTEELDRELRVFFDREIAAHVAGIGTLEPPPVRVVGALTTGEFSWGSFMRALGEYAATSGKQTIVRREIPQMIGKMAEIELSQGGKTWAQLYAAMALHSYGKDLSKNGLWQSLSAEQKEKYRQLLDPARFYDAKTHTLIHLPENYFGVAARIAAIDYDLGLEKDRAALDDLLSHAAKQFTDGAIFADDALPTGRYDRYSNEYARAIYEAANLAGREDLMKALSPSLKEQMKLWWDLLSPDGYGYSWGRSLGDISYMDTMEIVGFLGEHPEFRPAPFAELASAYFAAWSWLRNDFNDRTHLLGIFAFGRGDYSYITEEREWQQTTTFLAKIIHAHKLFLDAANKEGLREFGRAPALPDVAEFHFFRRGGGRQFGVWIVRQHGMQVALPFVTGPKAGTSDYEPAPFGFANIASPVEKIYPCVVPFLELEDGKTIAAVDGADEIGPAADGKSVTALWKKWVTVGGKAGEWQDTGLTAEVTWSLQGQMLVRTETLTASKTIKVRRLWMAVPSRGDRLETIEDGKRLDRITGERGTLEIEVGHADWPVEISAYATSDHPLGRSDRGPIPLHLILEARDISFLPDVAKKWEIRFTAKP